MYLNNAVVIFKARGVLTYELSVYISLRTARKYTR